MSYQGKWPSLVLAALLTAAGLASTAAAQLPNLSWYHYSQCDFALTPTAAPVTGFPVTLPGALPGNMTTIYLTRGIINIGGDTPTPFEGTYRLDGAVLDAWVSGAMIGNSYFVLFGSVPYNVRGGRHTLGYTIDDPNQITESNENDNVWAHQFVFTPYVLTADVPKWRGTPPPLVGGTFDIVDGSPIAYNCDGLRFTSTGWWNAVTLYAENDADDYDMQLFAPSTGPENGFFSSITGSYALAGRLDAVVVNRNTVGAVNYDAGVIKSLGGGPFFIEQVTSLPAGIGASMSVTLGADDYLRIWDTWISVTGWVTVAVSDPAADGEEIKVGWLDRTTTVMGLTDKSDWVVTDDNGEARLHRNFTTTGYYGLVIYRDPVEGGLPKTLQVDIETTPPDLIPYVGPQWYSALVPSPVPVAGTPFLPDTLHGYIPETYLNAGAMNDSPTASTAAHASVYQDGMSYWFVPMDIPALASYGHWGHQGIFPYEYPGGRHVLTLELDFLDVVHEIYENNNLWGEQFCWSPLHINLGGQYSHFYPGPLTGGWGTLDPAEPFLFNCDGYRFYAGYSEWEGIVLTQGPNSDYDPVLHYPLVGVKDGFDDFLKTSLFVAGETDYILFNNNLLPTTIYDFGIENWSGTEDYTVETVGSINLPDPVHGTYGPYTMGISHMMNLYNIHLEADLYAFRLENLTGAVDWGIGLHPHDLGLQERLDVVEDGYAWLHGPGGDEWFTVNLSVAGYYGLAVYKTGPFEFDKSGTYQLRILQGVSGVDDTAERLPAATGLTCVYPNPFNPQTTISYDLAEAGPVELTIFDLKGRLVRRLVQQTRPAGTYRVVWNGEDGGGARVGSGVYVARLVAGEASDAAKVVVVK